MRVIIILLLICQLIKVSPQQYDDLKLLIKSLNKQYRYETVTIFISEELWSDCDNLFPLLSTIEESSWKPKLIITKQTTMYIDIERILNGSPLSLVLAENHESYIIDIAKILLRGVRHNPIIFYLRDKKDLHTMEDFTKFCVWSAKTQFINALVMFQNLSERYGCELFPKIQTVNQTKWPTNLLFSISTKHKPLNFKRKIFEFPIAEDKPRAFVVSYNENTTTVKSSGLCWKMFKYFILQSNGELLLRPLYKPGESYKPIHEILEMIANKSIVASPNCFTDVDLKRFSTTYPIQIVDWCLMVPIVRKVPSYEYILTPFQMETKLIISAAVILSGGIFWILLGFNNFSLGVLNGLCGFIDLAFCSNLEVFHRHISRCFQILIRLAGFICCNYYNALLSSFLATTIFGKQIDSFEDLIKSEFNLMMRYTDSRSLKKYNLSNIILDRFIIKNGDVLAKHRDSLDRSYVYPVSSDRWYFHNLQQNTMRVKYFRYTKMCFGQYLLTFPLWYDSLFKEPLDYFILKSLSGGLTKYWTDESFRDFKDISNMTMAQREPEAMPMDLVYFTYAWFCIAIGLVISLVGFLLELVYFNLYFKFYKIL